jgi:hypothetical protein
MLNNLKKLLKHLKQGQTGRFLFSQLTHTMITLSVLALLLVGARQVGALNRVLAPAAQTVGNSFSTINYQGRLADNSGQPEDGTFAMSFAIYDAATDGNLIWGPEEHTVEVSDGLFSVGLGSKTSGGIPTSVWRGDRYLEISVNNEALAPRELLRSAPVTQMALDVAAGTITSTHLMDGAVTSGKLDVNDGLDVNGQLEIDGRLRFAENDGDYVWFSETTEDDNNDVTLRLTLRDDNSDKEKFEIYADFWDGEAKDRVVHDFTAAGNAYHYRDLHVGGDFTVDGEKSAVVETENYGDRKLYAFEQPTNRFADEGVATLTDGSARVVLDPVFLETVADDFHIHLTPYGDASLYVAEIGADYFVVKSQEEGADVDFAWLLTATREGYEGVRLESAAEEE